MKVREIPLKTPRFTLYPLSDVHWPEHDDEKLRAWRETVLDDPFAVVTLGGDMIDFCRTTLRSYLSGYTADTNSMAPINEMAMNQVEGLAQFLRPVADKIALVSVGNHAWRFPNGRMSDQELALALGRGEAWCGAFGLAHFDLSGRARCSVALHHDAGRKGGTASTDLLAFVHWSNACGADIYCAGHTHRQYAGVFNTRMTTPPEGESVKARHLVFMRSGAFLKGYGDPITDATLPYEADYAEEKMLAPSVLGIVSCSVEATPLGKLMFETRQRTL